MRTILISILAALVLVAPNASAHTYLDTTNPADGAVVAEPLQSVVLTYAGTIEEGSTFKVVASDGEEVDTVSMELVDGILTGTFAAPLSNDSYTVEWNSISEDGHPLSGQFGFTVDAPVTEQPVEEEPGEEKTAESETTAEEAVQTEATDTDAADGQAANSNMPLIIVGIILLLVIVVSIIAIAKRKDKK